jgi:hypothetical protein
MTGYSPQVVDKIIVNAKNYIGKGSQTKVPASEGKILSYYFESNYSFYRDRTAPGNKKSPPPFLTLIASSW